MSTDTNPGFPLFDLTPMLGRQAQADRPVAIAGQQTNRRTLITVLVALVTAFLPLGIGLRLGMGVYVMLLVAVWVTAVAWLFNARQRGGLRLRHSERLLAATGSPFGSANGAGWRFTNNVPLLCFRPLDLEPADMRELVPGAVLRESPTPTQGSPQSGEWDATRALTIDRADPSAGLVAPAWEPNRSGRTPALDFLQRDSRQSEPLREAGPRR